MIGLLDFVHLLYVYCPTILYTTFICSLASLTTSDLGLFSREPVVRLHDELGDILDLSCSRFLYTP